MEEKFRGYCSYEDMDDADKQKVDMIHESYRAGGLDGISTDQVEYFIAKRLNREEIEKINDKLDTARYKRFQGDNQMRQYLFEERLNNGYYGDKYPQAQQNKEVEALRKEVSEMKDTIGELTKLLYEKLK